jgi:hypothetical protein
LPLLASDPTGPAQFNSGMRQPIDTFDTPLHPDPAVGTRAAPCDVNVRFLYQHNSPPLCWVALADYNRKT